MIKYIVIWLCIGFIVTLIYCNYYYKFDVNKMFDRTEFKKWNLTDEEYDEITSSNIFMQIVVSIAIILLIITWPMLIRDFVRTFKRKLR